MATTARLRRLNVLELEQDPISAGKWLMDILPLDRAFILELPGYSAIHNESLNLAKWFFSLPEYQKRKARGRRAFGQALGHSYIACEFLGETYRRPVADFFGKERGWVPVGQSNTGVPKEYFQYGLELSCSNEVPDGWIANVWPGGDRASTFKKTKLKHIDLFARVHLGIFRALSCCIFSGQKGMFHHPIANILCRDTHYLSRPVEVAERRSQETPGQWIRNPPHVDLGEGTLIKVVHGLQVYLGNLTRRAEIAADVSGWTSVDESSMGEDDLLFIPGLALEIRLGGRVRAAWHRVVGTEGDLRRGPRYSIVSFGNAGVTDTLAPIEALGDAKEPRYFPIRRDHLPIVGNTAYIDGLSRVRLGGVDFRGVDAV